MAYIVMAYVVMAYVVMSYIVMAWQESEYLYNEAAITLEREASATRVGQTTRILAAEPPIQVLS